MKYLHTMVRVSDVDRSLEFYCEQLKFLPIIILIKIAGTRACVRYCSSCRSIRAGDSEPEIDLPSSGTWEG